MICPSCGATNSSYVIDSRSWPSYIYRRRRCTLCGARWTTHEYQVTNPLASGPSDSRQLRDIAERPSKPKR